MDRMIRAIERWPLWVRIAVTTAAVMMAYLIQVPLEHQIPGEPFLLFSLVVICTTLTLGPNAGYIAVGLTTLLLTPFFEPRGAFALTELSRVPRRLVGLSQAASAAGSSRAA